jgi:hypothetical protein
LPLSFEILSNNDTGSEVIKFGRHVKKAAKFCNTGNFLAVNAAKVVSFSHPIYHFLQ